MVISFNKKKCLHVRREEIGSHKLGRNSSNYNLSRSKETFIRSNKRPLCKSKDKNNTTGFWSDILQSHTLITCEDVVTPSDIKVYQR